MSIFLNTKDYAKNKVYHDNKGYNNKAELECKRDAVRDSVSFT